jgi:hypothetical protein
MSSPRSGLANQQEWEQFGHKFGERCGQNEDMANAKEKQRSPVFVQFIDCVWQVQQQNPTAFQFTEAFLLAVLVLSFLTSGTPLQLLLRKFFVQFNSRSQQLCRGHRVGVGVPTLSAGTVHEPYL